MTRTTKTYAAVANEYKQAVDKAESQALAWLDSVKNIRKGTYVWRRPNPHRSAATFVVDRIEFDCIPMYLYGRKVRKDGTLGDHRHPIGTPDQVEAAHE